MARKLADQAALISKGAVLRGKLKRSETFDFNLLGKGKVRVRCEYSHGVPPHYRLSCDSEAGSRVATKWYTDKIAALKELRGKASAKQLKLFEQGGQ